MKSSIIKLLKENSWVDMSKLNKDVKYKSHTYGKNPKKVDDTYIAKEYVRIEHWSLVTSGRKIETFILK